MRLANTFPRTLWMLALAGMCGATLLAEATFAQDSPPPNSLARLYETEVDAIGKAKSFPKYGDALFAQVRDDVGAGQYPAALSKMEDYIARLKAMREELKAAVPNPEKKANGFKQLQIHVRRIIRTLTHTIVTIPVADRGPFLAGRKDIENIDRELISDLFPRQPGRKEPDKKEKP